MTAKTSIPSVLLGLLLGTATAFWFRPELLVARFDPAYCEMGVSLTVIMACLAAGCITMSLVAADKPRARTIAGPTSATPVKFSNEGSHQFLVLRDDSSCASGSWRM